MEKTCIELENEFEGTGEVKGFKFTKIDSSAFANLYKVTEDGVKYHYEVFTRKFTPTCIDFEKKIFSETDFKEIYPKSNHFGVWAWTFRTKEKAIEKFKTLSDERQNN